MTELKESGLELIKSEGGKDYYLFDLTKLDCHPWKDGYIAVCPVCRYKHLHGIDGFYEDENYSKRKLGVNSYKSVGHCFRCNSILLSINGDATAKVPKVVFHNLIASESVEVTTLVDASEKYAESKELGDPEIELLKIRNADLDPVALGMKMARWNRPNILTPFYLNGVLIYYQLRFLDNLKPKYFSPSIKNKPIYIPDKEYSPNIIICEGVYDAIALKSLYPDWTPVAVLGSAITEYQCNLIRKYITPDRIWIFMDKIEISDGIKKTIMDTPLSYYVDEVKVITQHDVDGSDPEEILRGYEIDIAKEYESIIQRR